MESSSSNPTAPIINIIINIIITVVIVVVVIVIIIITTITIVNTTATTSILFIIAIAIVSITIVAAVTISIINMQADDGDGSHDKDDDNGSACRNYQPLNDQTGEDGKGGLFHSAPALFFLCDRELLSEWIDDSVELFADYAAAAIGASSMPSSPLAVNEWPADNTHEPLQLPNAVVQSHLRPHPVP